MLFTSVAHGVEGVRKRMLALRFSSLFFVAPIALGYWCRCLYVQGMAAVLRHRGTTPSGHAACAQDVSASARTIVQRGTAMHDGKGLRASKGGAQRWAVRR